MLSFDSRYIRHTYAVRSKVGLYCSYTFTNRRANVRRISIRKERHTYVTASKASVAVTLHDRLIREGSQRRGDFFNMFKKSPHVISSFDSPYIRHTYAVRTYVTQHECSAIVARSLDTPRQRGKSICLVRVAYEELSRRTFLIHSVSDTIEWRIVEYVLRTNGVRTTYLAIPWRFYYDRAALQ